MYCDNLLTYVVFFACKTLNKFILYYDAAAKIFFMK